MGYRWYADVFFLVNFMMNTSSLFFAAACCGCRVAVRRILLTAAGTVLVRILLLILLPGRIVQILLVHMVLNPLMVYLAFLPEGRKAFIRLLISVCVILLLAGGVQESLWLQAGVTSEALILSGGIMTMAAFALWQLRRRFTEHICVADLWFDGQRISVKAYCDSGNRLRHPESGKPVSIVDRTVIPAVWLCALGEPEQILCRTVSDDASRLEVITLDRMDIYLRGRAHRIRAPLLGLHTGTLMEDGEVQMLLNAAVC